MKKNPRPCRAFTLIELLTVIAIIGVLAAIIIPVVSNVRQSAKTAQGVSNLRQIALATLTYASENRQVFPYAEDNKFFYTRLSAYLASNSRDTNQEAKYNEVFRDPLAAIDRGDNHYTANNNMMGWGTPRRITEFSNPGKSIMYFDGAQVYSGNTDVAGWAVDNGGLNGVRASTRSATWLNTTINPGPNTDTATANIRWRVANGTAAKFAFLDAHVAVLKPADVKRYHFTLD